MKSYYYEENNTQKGPVSLEELKEKINQKTRVWTEGLPDWIEAQDLEELKTIFNLSMPPPLNIPKKEKTLSRKRNVIFFIVFVVLVLGFFYWNNTQNNSSSDYYLQTQREKYIIRSSWRERITLEYDKPAVDYDFGGISNFEIQVDNNTNYEIDVVEVVVSYIKKNGELWKEEYLYFENIPPQNIMKKIAPSSNRGVRVQCKISYIKSFALELEEKM